MVKAKWNKIGKGAIYILIVFLYFVIPSVVLAENDLSDENGLEEWKDNLSKETQDLLEKNIQKVDVVLLEEFVKLKHPEINQTFNCERYVFDRI